MAQLTTINDRLSEDFKMRLVTVETAEVELILIALRLP